ncbi:DHS-like NAD/FAD-binding domain-containing protein [Immersiella caudata]|uniref:DHS-like NAD/FAD-binding domain-containing protein n=1 Tax=Immersiella caudata TaxID=314043 RepID=A0AA39WVU0_9PEZI|nr:DHS-like NAD/FAD-binding domain-containing protein [Immersiella caudata]
MPTHQSRQRQCKPAKMSQQTTPSGLDPVQVSSFRTHLSQSTRIVTIIGAGLSASSGLPTFRDINGLWCNHDVFLIASPAGFRRDPGLVWQFYSERRRAALRAGPNPAHYALVNLAKAKPGFVALSQNVDGLLQRAGLDENPKQLKLLHGNLFDLACAGNCGYVDYDNFVDPLCEVLSEGRVRASVMGADVAEGEKPPKASALLFEGIAKKNKKILGEEKFAEAAPTARDAAPLTELGQEVRVPEAAPELYSGIEKAELPQCPGCGENLLRPRVVWFGEALPEDVMEDVDALFKEEKVDLAIVVGTSSQVWPAAGFCEEARGRGAKVAWVNMSEKDCKNAKKEDWVFLGDAAVILPEILNLEGQE